MKHLFLIFLFATNFVFSQTISIPSAEQNGAIYIGNDGRIKSKEMSVTAFRASSTTAKVVYITDRGKEGFFYRDVADTGTADNLGLCLVNSKGVRYKRIISDGNYLVSWFDTGAANAVTALNNASANTPGGGFLHLAYNKTYLVTGTWSLTKNAQNDTTQTRFTVIGHGSKIISTNASDVPALRVYNSKNLTLDGVEVQALTAFEGLWWSTVRNCKFNVVTFNKGDVDYFNQTYWSSFYDTRFTGIEIYTGTSGALSEHNANNFFNCNFRDVPYLIKLYGTESAQVNNFFACDFSNVGTKILYVDAVMKNAQLNFYSGYFDDYDALQGFDWSLKGVEVNFYGNNLGANISVDFATVEASQMELSFAKGDVGNRIRTGEPSSNYNLIKNGDLQYGDAAFFVNGSLTKAIISDTAYFGRALRVTGSVVADTYFESIAVPYDGVYSCTVIGKNTGGKTLTPVYQVNGVDILYTPLNFPTTKYTVSGFSCTLKKGDVFRIVWYTQDIAGNQFEISYVGLTFGKKGNLGAMPHPLAEEAVSAAAGTFDPPSVAAGGTETTTITLNAAALGDYIVPSFSLSLGGLILSAYVESANTVRVSFFNPTGSSINLGSGQLRAKMIKPN